MTIAVDWDEKQQTKTKSFWFDRINHVWSIEYINGSQVKIFYPQIISLIFGNSVDLNEMLHYAAFHLGLNCLLKYAVQKVY